MYQARCVSFKGTELARGTTDDPAPVRGGSRAKPALNSLLTRPDPSFLSEVIPVFFIGKNADGFWVARNADGTSGGLFLLKSSANRFARNAPLQFSPATITVSKRFELDIANQGNRYADRLIAMRRKLAAIRKRLTGILFAPARALFRSMAARRIHRAAIRLTSNRR